MKLFKKLFDDTEKQTEKTNLSVKQHGDNPISIKGNVKNSYVGCTVYIEGLEPQWKDRLDVYTATLKEFKPKTALTLLENLENNFITATSKPSEEFKALIFFQKGICYHILNKKDEMCQCYISAYNINSTVIQFEEQAALSYFKIDETPKANNLADDLLKKYEFNPIAWHIKFLSNSTFDYDVIPKVVRQNRLFQQLLYNYFNVKEKYDEIIQMKKFSMLPHIQDYNLGDVTIENFDESIFYTNVFFSDYMDNYYFSFNSLQKGDIEILNKLEDLLKKITSIINTSDLDKEKYGALFFLYAYIQYVLTNDKKYISEIRHSYLKLEDKNEIFALLCANVLQLDGQIDFALEILNDTEFSQSNILFLKAFCFLKKNDKTQYGKAITEWIKSFTVINEFILDNILITAFTLKSFGEIENVKMLDLVQDKKFENEQLKNLVVTVVNSLINRTLNFQENSTFETLISNLQEPKLLLYIADSYYYCNMYEQAIELYKKYVDRNLENPRLFFYINSLYAAKKDSEELLSLLENWRLNFSFQSDLHRIEADLCSILHDWKRGLQICNSFLDKYPEDESFLTFKLKCLDLINEDWCNEEINLIAKILINFSFSIVQNIPVVAAILVNREYFVEGLEILYKYSNIKEVRSSYLFATLTYSQKSQNKEILKEYDTIIDGCFVKYDFEGKINFYEMSKNKSDNLYNELLGHKVGDIISVKLISNKDYSIRILRIMDKFLYLHDEILEEAKQPLSGLPMESFNFTSTKPEEMTKELIALFGKQGEEEKQYREAAITNYYKRILSFTEVIIQSFKNEYLGGYTNLIYEHSGIVIFPLALYRSLPQSNNRKNIIIDFSSLTILFQIAKEHNVTYLHKFLISGFTVDMIKRELRKIQSEPKSGLSVVVTSKEITKYQIPENAQQNNITYLENLLNWIQENCESVVSPRVIDFKRKIQLENQEDEFIDYMLNTLLVYEDKEGILLTDDFVYFKFKLAQIQFSMSSEQYVKSVLGEEHPALFEFIKNKYKGFTLTSKQLIDEFNKKLNSQDNYYTNCLENIGMFSALPCVHLVNAISQSQLDLSQQEIEIKNVFINMLKDGPLNKDILQHFEGLIAVQFIHSENILNFVYKCLGDVYQMLGIIKDE